MSGYEQLRHSIRRRFGIGKPFTIADVREKAPELSHLLELRKRVWHLAECGFLRVVKVGTGTNRFARRSTLTKFILCEESKGDCTVRRNGKGFVVELNRRLADRMDEVTDSLEISAVVYLRELVESDIARRSAAFE